MGTLRLYLAVCVFLWHCWFVDVRHVLYSFVAVYCFFILSGFLISMALSSRSYPATLDGTLRFYANRALRLFPTYFLVLAATAIAYALGLIPYRVTGLNTLDPIGLVDQITVLPHAIWRNITLSTEVSTNTLSIGLFYTVGLEMMFYLVAPFFVRCKLPNLILLFVASGIVHFLPYMCDMEARQWQYEFFPSTFVFFVAGSLSYRLYLAIKDSANRYAGWLLLLGVALYGAYFTPPIFTNYFQPIALYAAVTLLLPFLFIASEQPYVRPLDSFLGNLSYPVYVVHGLAAALVGGGVGKPTNIVQAGALTLLLATALYFFEVSQIDRVRRLIRAGHRPWPDFSFLRRA